MRRDEDVHVETEGTAVALLIFIALRGQTGGPADDGETGILD